MKREILSVLIMALLICCCAGHSHDIRNNSEGSDSSTAANAVYENWHDQARDRNIPVKIYLPRSGAAPFPVVIFSHGLGGSCEAAVYLGSYWSQHGYLCIFVQHAGSDAEVWQSADPKGGLTMFQRLKAAANGQNLIARAQDIKFTIDELQRRNQSDSTLKGKLNLNEIAVAGHSFGAGTSLAIAGQRFGGTNYTLQDKRVKAAIYLCPPLQGGNIAPDQAYGGIQIPGLLLTGTEDNSPIGETSALERRIPFDRIQAPHQYLVNFYGADHATFGGRSFRMPKDTDNQFHRMIEQVTTEFLDAALKNDCHAWQWLDSQQSVAYFGNAAAYERK